MADSKTTKLSNMEKAAVFLIVIGPKNAAQVLKNMPEAIVERLTVKMSKIRFVTEAMRKEVMEDLKGLELFTETVLPGGRSFVQEALGVALGEQKALDVIKRADLLSEEGSLNSLKNIDMGQLASFLRQEQPQTIALILSHLDPSQSAIVLSSLPEEMQGEVVTRIAVMDQTDTEIVRQIENVLKSQLSSSVSQTRSKGGAKSVAELLNFVDRSTEKTILRTLEEKAQDLAEEVKKLMFVFEDIVYVEDRSMQRVLKEVDTSEISLALKAASEDVKNKIFNNISKRAAEMIKEEIEFMGPVRLKDVEEAQQRIVNVVRRLEEEGEIVISGRGGGKDDVIV